MAARNSSGHVQAGTPSACPHTAALQAATDAVVLPSVADPREDMNRERARCAFDSHALACELHGGEEAVARRARLAALAKSEPLFDKTPIPFLSREQRYVRGAKVAVRLYDMVWAEGLERDDAQLLHSMIDELVCTDLHWGMFLPHLASQCDEEQQMEWVPEAMQLQVIGTYAQTELGHGTYIRGLETTATYDKRSQQFILHSPTITATKWWPGGLAKTVTHAVVMARMFIDGKDHGPHAFVVQLRDLETHRSLKGVTLGDIGPKMGFACVDNGFLRFDHVRIPRKAMLMGHARVEEDGTYVMPKEKRASYGTMIHVRSIIVHDASYALGKAVTIAIRYCAVRRQTRHDNASLETQVLDYQNTQATLFPLLATVFALHYTGLMMKDMYESFVEDRDSGSFEALPELHATAAALKAMCTWTTSAGIESCRLACGGHGYSQFSGLPLLYANYVACATYEGDNNVLCLQTARYLMKCLAAVDAGSGHLASFLSYLGEYTPGAKSSVSSAADCITNAEFHDAAFTVRANHLIRVAAAKLAASRRDGLSSAQAWNANIMDLIAAAKAHCLVVVQRTFAKGAAKIKDPRVASAMQSMVALFSLHHIASNVGDLLRCGFLTAAQAAFVDDGVRSLLASIRPNAVGYVDGLAYDDYELSSALGRRDGDVYNALLECARSPHNPMNRTEEGPAWQSVLKPLLNRSRL